MSSNDNLLAWVGSSRKDVRAFPEDVKDRVGFALRVAQQGKKHASAKPLKGFGSGAILEIVVDDGGRTFRIAYAVRLRDVVYVLHAFEKKSPRGIKTAAHDINTVRRRLREAETRYADWKQGKRATP